jgi:hypothetical protein
MTAFDERRPSPALVASAMALFASMGSEGHAAIPGRPHHSGASQKRAEGVTSAPVTKLIAVYLRREAGTGARSSSFMNTSARA